MKRYVYKELVEWKEKNIDTPLMIIGARQIEKHILLKNFVKMNLMILYILICLKIKV